MKRTIALAATVALLVTTPLFVPQAHAAGWVFGAAFQVGGLSFHIGYRDNHRHGKHEYYYRSRHHLDAHRSHYGGDCYYDDGYYYHDEACPLVRSYLDYYGTSVSHVFGRYAPNYDHRYGRDYGYHNRGHYDRGHYDRGHYDRGRSHRSGYYERHRYRHPPRHRGHRGHRGHSHRGGSCPYGG